MPKRTAHVFEEKWRSDDVKLQEATDFSSLLISERVLLGLKKAGYKNPSPIQVEAIPVGRFGNDLVVQAKSGTGKTLVFTIIALDIISVELKFPQVLILAPTREIAFQICDVIKAVGCTTENLKCGTFIGGLPVETDFHNLQGCQIVVGTPGRIRQLLELKTFKAHSIRLLVLDEADQLLEASFKSSMDAIFESLPEHKQIVATSATYPKSLAKLVNVYFKTNPTFARLNESDLALLGIMHFSYLVENTQMPVLAYRRKIQALETILTSVKFSQCLVFCNQVSRVETLCSDIKKIGFSATYISSAKDQAERLKAIDNLKRFKCKILVSSDVTSRGIDAENVDLIINVDLPYSTEVYLHRVGRAGRYGSKGVAITLLTAAELLSYSKIQKDGNFTAYELPDPVPEKLINWRPKTKLVKEMSNDRKSSLSDSDYLNDSTIIQNDKTVSNGIKEDTLSKSNSEDSDNNQNTSFEDSAVNQNNSSEDSVNQNNSSEDSVNQNNSFEDSTLGQYNGSEDSTLSQDHGSEDSAVNQNTSSEDFAINQNTSSEDSAVNQNNSSEDSVVNQNNSSEDSAVYQNTSSEDSAVSTSSKDMLGNQRTSSEDTSINQSTLSEDTSMNQSTTSEDTSNNQNISSDMSVNQILSFKKTVNKNIDSEETSSTNTVLTALGVVGQSLIDKDSDKIIGNNLGDVPSMNSKDTVSADEVDKKCVLNKQKNKKSNCTKVSKQKKSTSSAVSNSEQSCLNKGMGETGELLSENNIKTGKCTDEMTVFVMNFIEDYEKKDTADLSCPLVDNGDKPLCFLSSKETNNPNSSLLMRRSLIDYYYKVLQAFKSDFVAANGVEQLELMIAVNEDSSVEKCAAVHIEKDDMPNTDQINLSLWSKKLECSTFSASNCVDDSDVDSAEDILVSTPNAKASGAKNTRLVSSDPSALSNSVDYKGTSSSSSSKYFSKFLQLENAYKNKIETVNKMQASKNPKSKVQTVVSSDTESSSESETTSSSETDAKNVHNIKRVAVNNKPVPNHFMKSKSEVQNIEGSRTESSDSETTSSSNTEESNNLPLLERGSENKVQTVDSSDTESSESETTSSSGTDSLSNSEGSNMTLLERAFREMRKSDNKLQTLPEQAEQLKQILQEIHSKEEADDDSLSDIQICTAGACSSRKSHNSDYKSSMKSESSKIPRDADRSSAKKQQIKYQSYDQEESVSHSSESNCSQKRKVSKLTKSKTRPRGKGLTSQLNRNEGFRVAEPNNYLSHPHTSRHSVGSHFNHQDYFHNAVYPPTGHDVRPSQYQCHRPHYNHHHNCPNAAYAGRNSSSQLTQCYQSHLNQGYLQNAAHPNRGHSRSTQHYHGMNASTAHPLASESSSDMYYRQWYWIQQGTLFQ